MVRCSAKTLTGKRCKNKCSSGICWVHNKIKCGICLEETSKNIITLDCKHKFCKDCIYEWVVVSNQTCPICRTDISILREPACYWGIDNNILVMGIEIIMDLSAYSLEKQKFFMDISCLTKNKYYTIENISFIKNVSININDICFTNMWNYLWTTSKKNKVILDNKDRKIYTKTRYCCLLI